MSSIMDENSRSEKDALKTFLKQNITGEKMEAEPPVIDYKKSGQKKPINKKFDFS